MRATCWPRPKTRFQPIYRFESYQRQLLHCPYDLRWMEPLRLAQPTGSFPMNICLTAGETSGS
jgi:hypothetical protein